MIKMAVLVSFSSQSYVKVCRSSLRPFKVLFSQWVCGFVSHQRRYGFPHLLDKRKVVCGFSNATHQLTGINAKCSAAAAGEVSQPRHFSTYNNFVKSIDYNFLRVLIVSTPPTASIACLIPAQQKTPSVPIQAKNPNLNYPSIDAVRHRLL